MLLGARPGPSAVGGAVDGGAVDLVVRRRVDRPVARVDDCVEDRPAGEERAREAPVAPALVALEDEEALPRSDQDADHHQSPGPDPVPTTVNESVATAGTSVPNG